MSQTLTLTGDGNKIIPKYFPPIRLDPQQEYVLGLVGFYGVDSIRNIGNNNDKFYYGNRKRIDIPWGAYEVTAIIETIKQVTNKPMLVKGTQMLW